MDNTDPEFTYVGAVYKATNTVNGKIYVGITTLPLHKRIQLHLAHAKRGIKSHFANALRTYAKEVFEWEVIRHCTSAEEMDSCEKEIITELKATDPDIGYNLLEGGRAVFTDNLHKKMSMSATGRKLSEEARHKVSVAMTGRPCSEETRRKMSIANSGRILTSETRARMSKAKKGHKLLRKNPLSEETKRRMSLAKMGNQNSKGHKISDELRAAKSEAMMGNTHGLGHLHTTESKQKISEALKGNTYRKGKPQSAEIRMRISMANKGNQNAKGHRWSEEERKQISANLRRRWEKVREEKALTTDNSIQQEG